MSTLYVTQPGARLEKEYKRLLITFEDEILMRVPLSFVSQVVLVGRVGVTTPALHAILGAKIPLQMVSRSGKILGRLLPPVSANLELRRKQILKSEEETFCFQLSSEIVKAKLRNQRVLALRVIRRHPEIDCTALDRIRQAENNLETVLDLDSLRGFEGSGARAYFNVYKQAFDPSWKFTSRNRRPPRDPVNALLSLGYTLTGNALGTALEITGLDPYLGFFHQTSYGRPALALDLLEEFRAPLVDSFVMSLINRKYFDHEGFEERISGSSDKPGVYLKDRGFKIFLREFSEKMESEIHIPETKKPMSYRKIFEIQARKLANFLLHNDKYEPFSAR